MGFEGQPIGSSVNIYNSDGLITDATRNVQIGTTLNFLYGAAGVNGSVQMTSGGYFKNITNVITNYFEYDNNTGLFSTVTATHTRTGFRTEKSGSWVEMVHDGTRGYFNTNGYIEWYVNNIGIYAGMLNSSGNWGFGGTSTTAKVTISGSGNTAATLNQYWKNLAGTALMSLNDGGVLGLGVNAVSESFAQYDSANGNYIIGNAARGAVMPGTFVSIPVELRYNYSRSGATGDTGHTLGLFNLTSRALANAAAGSSHHIFDIVGVTNNLNPIVSIRENGNIIQQLFRDGKFYHAGLPTYADEAAAIVGGLPTDHFYKTATGELRIKL